MNELKNKTIERFEIIQMLRLRCFRQVAKENYIPCRQYPIMEYLMEHDGCSQIEISKYFHISAAAITKSIDRLEKSNFVVRKADQENKRANLIYLTDLGKDTFNKASDHFERIDELMLNKLNENDLHKLVEYFDLMLEGLYGQKVNENNINELFKTMVKEDDENV